MMVKYNDAGEQQWSDFYGNYPDGIAQFKDSGEGNGALVYNECWGVAPKYDADGVHDGYVMSCGTGIEGCFVFGWNRGPFTTLECR